MLQARSKSQCSSQYFERQTRAGFGSMTRYTCETVSSAQQTDRSFRVSQDRDATPELYAAIGRTAKISALAHAMIVGSSNLAANLLLDFVGVEYARTVLRGSGS